MLYFLFDPLVRVFIPKSKCVFLKKGFSLYQPEFFVNLPSKTYFQTAQIRKMTLIFLLFQANLMLLQVREKNHFVTKDAILMNAFYDVLSNSCRLRWRLIDDAVDSFLVRKLGMFLAMLAKNKLIVH